MSTELPEPEIPVGLPRAEGHAAPRGLGMPIERIRLVAFERSLSEVGVEGLEEILSSTPALKCREWFEADRSVRELALLRTCQRICVLALVDGSKGGSGLADRLGELGAWTVRSDDIAVRHLYRTAAGLLSRIEGERDIQDQLRSAASSVHSRHARPVLRSLLEAAVRSADRAVGEGALSVADVAAQWLLDRVGGQRVRVLIIGTGAVGRRLAERLAPRAHVTLLHRSHAPEPAWTAQWGLETCGHEELRDRVARADAVVAAARSSERILRETDLPPATAPSPRWFIDLGLPRNLDPAIGSRPGVELVDLATLPPGRLAPDRADVLTREMEEAAREGAQLLAAASIEPWIAELRSWAEAIRAEEWERALGHSGPVPEEARIAFERLSDRLVRRLLAGPTRELRDLPPTFERDLDRRRILRLFRPDDFDP